MTDKKYCIMDMDGTLIDSMPYWNTLSPDYLVERGKKNMTFPKRRKRSCGSSTKSCAGIMRRTFL